MDSSPVLPAQLTARDLAERLRRGERLTIVDVREADELAIARFPAAVHIPLATLPLRVGELPAGPLVMACHHGGRSARAVQFLRSHGRTDVANLDGGIDAWAADVDLKLARY
ncbi:MAG: rhodanese-like domain-containing protein [Candidatus Eisenbacteria bacterium]